SAGSADGSTVSPRRTLTFAPLPALLLQPLLAPPPAPPLRPALEPPLDPLPPFADLANVPAVSASPPPAASTLGPLLSRIDPSRCISVAVASPYSTRLAHESRSCGAVGATVSTLLGSISGSRACAPRLARRSESPSVARSSTKVR